MTGPLIHIGFHKTASTLLQRKLFMMENLGFVLPEGGRVGIHAAFITRYGLDPVPTERIDKLRAEQAAAEARGGTLVISHERLSGYPASGGFDQGLIAERLAAAFPEARIVMLIREQQQMLYSMYLQTISDGGTLSLKRFLDRPDPVLMRKPGFDLGYYEYDRLIRAYHSLFGAERVKVIPYERFRQDSAAHARALTEFALGPDAAERLDAQALESPVNPVRPLAFQALRRQMNRLVRNQLNENGLLPIPNEYVEYGVRRIVPFVNFLRVLDPPIKARLQARIARACAGRFGASNARTSALIGEDLAALGYEVTS